MNSSDPIFQQLPGRALEKIATYIAWDPLVTRTPPKLLSEVESKERLNWLNSHRPDLERHISWVGTPIFSYAFGTTKSYREIVIDLADQIKVECSHSVSTAEIESRVVGKVWNDTYSRLTPELQQQLLLQAQTLAEKYAPGVGIHAGAFAGLAAAQMSGFGVYLLGSTLLGAINSALGLGLGFGAFTGLSSLISLAIGPIGWAGLGVITIRKLGAPNYKKLLPVVILIAAERVAAGTPEIYAEEPTDSSSARTLPQGHSAPPVTVVDYLDRKEFQSGPYRLVRDPSGRLVNPKTSRPESKRKPATEKQASQSSKSEKTIWNIAPE